jgi:hypothetical protein
MPCYTSWINVIGVWARLPLVVEGVLHDLDGREVEAHSTPLTIPDVGFE